MGENEVDSSTESENRPGIETPEALTKCHRRTTCAAEAVELPVSSDEGLEWSSEMVCRSCSKGVGLRADRSDIDDDLICHDRLEDRMTEAELWQQLERELYQREAGEGMGNGPKDIPGEGAAAMAKVGEAGTDVNGRSAPRMKEAHRFFPPGMIMHIVAVPRAPEAESHDNSSCSSSASSSESEHAAEPAVRIFLTPRSLYGKIRLSKSMISDHFMPVYRRQMEKLIRELEEEEAGSF